MFKEKWDETGYKEKCKKAAENRASNNRGGSIHSGGQTSGATFCAEFFKIHGREPTLCDTHEFFHRRPNGTWDTEEAARVQREMDAFEEAFDTQQNTLPPTERATEEIQDAIMVDQFVEFVGGMPKNRLKGQANASSLVIRTPMGYRIDPSSSLSSVGTGSSTARSHAAVNFEEMERRLKADNDARVQAEVASQLQSSLDAMRSQLRAEAMEDMELLIQRRLSQCDIQGQQYHQQQHSQHMPPCHSAHASSHPDQQQTRPVPQMPPRHSVHETSRFQPMPFQSSSHEQSGSSSRFPGQTSESLSYQELGYRPN
ncbi:hypothetical protein A2U01_0015192, partial [Trifolium medium]|nr:hypothetical protein [Trifolium medium]